MNNVDPEAWLTWVLERIADHRLTPSTNSCRGTGSPKTSKTRPDRTDTFKALTQAKFDECMGSDLPEPDLVAIRIDGRHPDDRLLMTGAVGIEVSGQEHPPGIVEGATGNAATSMNSSIRRVCRDVKRWRDAGMAPCWTAAGMFEAGKGFRPHQGPRAVPPFSGRLSSSTAKSASLTGSRAPHDLPSGSAARASFNIKRDIPGPLGGFGIAGWFWYRLSRRYRGRSGYRRQGRKRSR